MFILQMVNGAHGNNEEISWAKAHEEKFETLVAARMAAHRDTQAMRERCGPQAWDSHRRIVPTADLPATYTCSCWGRTGDGSHAWLSTHIPCPQERHTKVVVLWLAGEPAPGCPTPEGWASPDQCQACREAEAAWENRQLAEMEAEATCR